MLNRWNETEAAGLDPLGQLVYQSRLLGAETNLVVWGGGNTSLKVMETDFRGRETYVLRVKGSGSDMKTIERKHFSGVRMEDILPLEEREEMSDEEMVAYLAHTLVEPSSPRPSIETLLHGFLPYASVVHTHADAIVSLTNSTPGRQAVIDCFGEEVLIVDYIRPGFQLSKMVAAAARANPQAHALVLMHHGFITWANTPREAYDMHIAMVTRAEEYLAEKARGKKVFGSIKIPALGTETRRSIAAAVAPTLRGTLSTLDTQCTTRRFILRFDDSEDILDFLGTEEAARLAQIGPATPDHLLHTKRTPLFLDVQDPQDIDAIKTAIREQAPAWAHAYREYFRRNHLPQDEMLEPIPRIVLLPGVGMWTLGKDAKTAWVPGDIYHHTIHVMQGARSLGDYASISEKDAYDVEYWPLELYKLTLAPPEKELARRIALITGAVGAIGRAIADRFAKEGAHVAVTDLDGAACEAVAREICARHGAGVAVGIPMDVTREESVHRAFQEAVLAFGGLDILVSNAGIAHSARIEELALADWQRSLDVNATGHFLVAREAVRLFREQGMGGNIILNVTKNALAAGAEFGAYSAAKAAELQLGRVLAIENGPLGIRVNMINPDAIFSAGLWSPEMKARRARAQGIPVEQVEEFYRQRNLLKASVTAEDVAEAALWLASDRSAKTTGCIIPVDGGVREAFPR